MYLFSECPLSYEPSGYDFLSPCLQAEINIFFKSETVFFGFCNLENGYLKKKTTDKCGLINAD